VSSLVSFGRSLVVVFLKRKRTKDVRAIIFQHHSIFRFSVDSSVKCIAHQFQIIKGTPWVPAPFYLQIFSGQQRGMHCTSIPNYQRNSMGG
jgi:hypothetical protein